MKNEQVKYEQDQSCITTNSKYSHRKFTVIIRADVLACSRTSLAITLYLIPFTNTPHKYMT